MHKSRKQQRKIRAVINLMDRLSSLVMVLEVVGYIIFMSALIIGVKAIGLGMSIFGFVVSLWMFSMNILIIVSTVSCKSLVLSICRVIVNCLGLYFIAMVIIVGTAGLL